MGKSTTAVNVAARAAKAGFDTLLVTVDVPVAGARLRDRRNGMTIPPRLKFGTAVDALRRPAWWFDFLSTEPLTFASFDRWEGTVAELLDTMFDPTVTYEDLAWIKEQWPGKLVVKGILSAEDARLAAQHGADGVLVSNHGGRAEGSGRASIDSLVEVVAGVRGRVPVLVDSGFRRGTDVFKALALGATAVGIGRPYIWGLASFGQEGVEKVLEILRAELLIAMRQAGTRSIAEIDRSYVVHARQ